jgi:hypothetical protein
VPGKRSIAPEEFLALASPDVAVRREALRALAGGRYPAGRRVALLVASSVAGIAASLAFMRGWRWADAAAIPAALVFANFVEWAAHGRLLHGAGRSLPAIAHANHHLFCPATAMRVDTAEDLSWVLMPARAVVGVAAILLPLSLALARLTTVNAAALFAATGFAYFLLYELLHALFHAPAGARFADARWVLRLARHHARHHAHAGADFNVFWPLADRCLGTSRRRAAGR